MKDLIDLKQTCEKLYRADHFSSKKKNSSDSPPLFELIYKTVDQLKVKADFSVSEVVFIKEGNLHVINDKKGTSLDFENNFFDACINVNAIYFWEHPITYFKEIYRVLRPGGVFSLAFKEKKCGGNLPWTQPDFTFYDIREVETFFMESGFENIEVKQIAEETLDKEMITPLINVFGQKKTV